jgi:predicted ATPase/class 3 adenylate cyclase
MVTLLFTDIEGSTRAWEAHPQDMKVALVRHDEMLRSEIEAAGGYVFKTVGDAFCASFESAPMALGAAVTIQRALAVEPWPQTTPIRVRMALHSGQCEERGGDYFGPVVNRTARLEAVAHGGQVVLSGVTADLVTDRLPEDVRLRDLGEHHLKDLGRAERVLQVVAEGQRAEFPPLRSLDNPGLRHNLHEQVSSFVGRDQELATVRALMREARLVTLAGPGGVGKTRLALQVAAESLDGSGDGVWFVDLAPITDPALVAASVAQVLWVRAEAGRPVIDSLVDALGARRLLVVLDNCEQVIGAVAALAETLMRRCPLVTLLATSREPLGIGGEQVYRVPSLSVPGPEDGPTAIEASEAVRLFVERARQQKPGFVVNGDNAEVIGRLCRRLDGIPFALELAAARLRSVTVRDLEAHLDKRFRLLAGGARTALPRQQTLQALIDWSYDLLATSEQLVLDRLSVFSGGFDLDAAEAVCPGGEVEEFEILGLLDALVDKSLVQADDSAGGVRYRLLETMRDYAETRLVGHDERQRLRVGRAHREYFMALAEAAAPHLRGPAELEWGDRLDLELGNMRVALAHCLADPDPNPDTDPGLRLGVALTEFWYVRGYGVEGAQTLVALLRRPLAQAPTRLRGRALAAAGRLVEHYAADYPTAIAMATEALAIGRTMGDDTLVAQAYLVLTTVRNLQGDFRGSLTLLDDALPVARHLDDPLPAAYLLNMEGRARYELGDDGRAPFEESAARCRLAGDRRGAAVAVANIGVAALYAGDLATAGRRIAEAVTVFRELGDRQALVASAYYGGFVAYLGGDDETASRLFAECIDIARRIGARRHVALAVLGGALIATHTGDAHRAAVLHGAFDGAFEQLGAVLEALGLRWREADHLLLRDRLGDGPFEAAYGAGRSMPLDAAVALAGQSA